MYDQDQAYQPSSGTAIVPHSFEELKKRSIQDPIENLLGTIDHLSDDEKLGILGFADHYEGSIFELRCSIFASFSSEGHLKAFITAYNAEAPNNCWQTISLDHAYDLAKIGRLLREAGKRIPDHFPLVPQTFFVIALRAGDRFFEALAYAEERFENAARDPENHSTLTTRAFRADILPKAKAEPLTSASPTQPTGIDPGHLDQNEEISGSGVSEVEPKEEETEAAQSQDPVFPASETEPEEVPVEVVQVLTKGEDSIEFRMTLGTDRIIDADFEILTRPTVTTSIPLEEDVELSLEEKEIHNCFGCTACQALGKDQRLAVVNVDSSGLPDRDEPIAGVFDSAPAWYCAPRKLILAARSQGPAFERAVSLARGCPQFSPISTPVEDGGGDPNDMSGPNLSASELAARMGVKL